jgi:hypothetical protein
MAKVNLPTLGWIYYKSASKLPEETTQTGHKMVYENLFP